MFWTTEVEARRMNIQRDLARRFESRSGQRVKVIPVEESRLSQKVIAARAARQLPDVVFVPASFAGGWARAGILDAHAATQVIERLGVSTFRGLNLLRIGSRYAAVPSDGWVTLTLYRRDRYRKRGLDPPRSWRAMLKAARALHNVPYQFGALVPTAPNYPYTQQVLEQLALSNGVRLIDDRGRVRLHTPAMVEVLKFYRDLAQFTPPANVYWKQTRLLYMVGRTSTIFWSPFILDELAGAREDMAVRVPELPRKTGAFSYIEGPRSRSGYLSTSNFGITTTADTGAKQFVRFMMNNGYETFFTMDPFGKLPMRTGTISEPGRFLQTWKNASPYLKKYPATVIDQILSGVEAGNRWGLARGAGSLVSRIYSSGVLSQILVRDFLRGSLTARETAKRMQRRVRKLRRDGAAGDPPRN